VTLTACLVIFAVSYGVFRRVSGISTEIGEQRTVVLVDGTALQLNTNSRVLVRYDNHRRQVILKSGEAYFNVAKPEARPFIVVAGDRKVIARGTSFLVRREESVDIPLTVTLIEGRVAVAPAGSADVLPPKSTADVTVMTPGERARFRRAGPPAMDTPTLQTVMSWRSGQLFFKGMPLRAAVAEINRYSQMQIAIAFPAEAAAKISVDGSFRAGDSSSFARAVADSNHLRLVEHDNELVLESM
jgi:transmembrane sensor